jgi:tetratricopeptide (TPR) repeat protein
MDCNKIKYRISSGSVKSLVLLLSWFLLHSAYMNAMTSPNDTTDKVVNDMRVKAIRYDRNNEVGNAIEFYSRYLVYNPKDIKLTCRLADLYFVTRNYLMANQYYDNVISINQRKYPLAWYRKGIACMSLEKYDESADAFGKFKKFYKDKKDRFNYRKLAVNYAASCDWAKKNMGQAANIVVTHQGEALNNPDIDFAPSPVDDRTLYYGAVYSDPSRHIDPIRQIYKAEIVDGKWKKTGLLEGEINNPEFNTGNLVISEDSQRLYFTRSRKNWQGEPISEIFMSVLVEGQWQPPKKLPYPVNSESYTSTQPALGINLRNGNEIIYFVSDRQEEEEDLISGMPNTTRNQIHLRTPLTFPLKSTHLVMNVLHFTIYQHGHFTSVRTAERMYLAGLISSKQQVLQGNGLKWVQCQDQ